MSRYENINKDEYKNNNEEKCKAADKKSKRNVALAFIVVIALYFGFGRDFINGFVQGFKEGYNETNTTIYSPTTTQSTTKAPSKPIEVKPEHELIANSYFTFEGIKFTHLGEYKFLIENTTKQKVRITVGIYGKKKDGTYKWLETPSFYGMDEYQYQKDMKENGWATYDTTNCVRAGKSQEMQMHPFESEDTVLDVDNDGMYDICFCISPQTKEGYISSSTDDPKTPFYKIKAD